MRARNGEVVGKCPAAFPADRRQSLLDGAVGYLITQPYSEAFPKRLFAVDIDGTIYTAQTTNPGDAYHGYPYSGRMGKRLVAALKEQAQQKGCAQAFDLWVRRHIQIGGPPDL